MKEDQTLADFFTLTEKHALWDDARCANKTPEQPRKESTIAQKKKHEKQYNKSRQEAKQDMSKLDHTKYYTFHRGPDQTNDDCYTWKNYLKKLMKEGKVNKYLDKPIAQPRRNADANKKPLAKTIWINGIFIEFEHLGATNNSKKRNIQQALLVSQVQVVNTKPRPIVGFTTQNSESVDFPHNDTLVVSVQLGHAIVDNMMADNISVINLLHLLVIQNIGLKAQSYMERKYSLDSTDTPRLSSVTSHLT
ncbi:hypothetical protein ACFX16_003012 [Malus domestica]